MHVQTAHANWMVEACGESNTPCLKNPRTNTKKFSLTSDTSLVLRNLQLKFVQYLLKGTAIFAISSLYLGLRLAQQLVLKKSSSIVTTVRKGGLLLVSCLRSTHTNHKECN